MEYQVESERVVAFRVEIAKILKSNDAALMFQQLCHWSKYSRRKDGFVYKTARELFEETNVSERKQRKARQVLIDAGWIEAEKKMANGSPTWHYRVITYPYTVLTSSTDILPKPTSENASSITKKTHENLLAEVDENVEKLYKGWLIEMVIGSRVWKTTNESDRLVLLEKARTKVRLSPVRKKKLAARIDSLGFSLCAKAIKNTAKSDFHTGNNDTKWKATIDWLFKGDSKVEEMANR